MAELGGEWGPRSLSLHERGSEQNIVYSLPNSFGGLQRVLKERGGLGYEFVGVRVRRADGGVEWLGAELKPISGEPWAVAFMFMRNAARIIKRR
ncbi:MAG: hypothetical protein DRJ69_05465 [Thermoprotei archaeon]|nr:MAG: hypothetical protein DRJ69_05465 [Thermoprotei archaeon]